MFCLESREEMPASADEIEEALEDGVEINNSWGPKEILKDENGKVKAIVFKKCLSVFDDEHRFSPKYDENDTVTIECNNVLMAIGQSAEWGNLLDGSKVELNRNGTAKADPVTYQTGEPDIFVGGDIYTGPKFVIDAIAAGKEGADSLHRFVHEGHSLTLGRVRRDNFKYIDKSNVLIPLSGYDSARRNTHGVDESKVKTFRDERLPFTEEQVKAEAARCLKCGAAWVDSNICIGCGLCTTRCKFDAIHLHKEYDAWGVPYEKLVGHVLKTTAQRVGRRLVKKDV
jgi:NADPH-dependent glutamate synthase beta subunit-like oxidoreductase